ncbi:MAG: segregation/condensation protein A [Ignavibacteria bacterium]|jgi:segregation and condensation protein A
MYKIKLDHFEGPLDLLLFFIKRDELDIYDIPISHITSEFLKYMEIIEQLDLESAGDFILMAATLMQIKAKMLLPKEVDEKGEEIDPRADLVKALLEFKKYKEMSEELFLFESDQLKRNYRANFESDVKETPPELDTLLRNITIYDLIKAFKKAMEEKPVDPVHEIKKINVTIDEQIKYLMDITANQAKVSFIELMKEMREKIRIVVTFIALLELVKMGRLGLKESEYFNDFEIYGLENG